MKRLMLIFLVLLCAMSAFGQSVDFQTRFAKQSAPFKFMVPATAYTVASKTVSVATIVLINKAGGSATKVKFMDRSTDCEGGACPFGPQGTDGNGIEVGVGQMLIIPMASIPATGGFTAVASNANTVVCHVIGIY